MSSFNKAVEYTRKSDIDSLKRLIEENPDIINERDREGRTILHYAVNKDNRDIVKLLIDHGVDVNVRDNRDQTPLHFVNKGSVDIVRLLLESGVDPNLKDKDRWVLLHKAAKRGDIEIVKILIKHGADVNMINDYSKTALHYAVERNFLDIAKLLILQDADISVKDIFGKTPLDYAEDSRVRNKLLFIYHNKEKILEEIDRQKSIGVEYDQF